MPRYPVPDHARRRWRIAPDLDDDALARLKGQSPEDAFGYTPQRVALAECGVYDLADLARALPEELLSVPGVHPQAIPWWAVVIQATLAGRRLPRILPGEIPPTPLRGYRRRPLPPAFADRMLSVSRLALAPVGQRLLIQGDRTLGHLCTTVEAGRPQSEIDAPVLTLVKALLVAEAEDALAQEPEGPGRYRIPFHVRPPKARRRLTGPLTSKEQSILDRYEIEDLRTINARPGRTHRGITCPTVRAIDRLGLLTEVDLVTLYTAVDDPSLIQDVLVGIHRILLDIAEMGSGDVAYPRVP